MRLVLLIGLPASVALFILAEPLIATLFHYGEMTDKDVVMSAISLRAYALGLVAFMLIKVLAPGYFARQDMKTPVKIAIKAMVANMVFNVILVFPLAHAGLALATALSAFLNAGLLYWGLRKTQIFKPLKGWWRYGVQLLLANAAMAGILIVLKGEVSDWLTASLSERIMDTGIVVVSGMVVYAFALVITGVRPSQFKQ